VRSQLVALAGERGVDLRLRGGIDDRELVALYQSSVATICAGAVEPFGLTTIESLACGTPVVAVNEGGYREVVKQGENGYLVNRRPDSLAAAVADVLEHPDRWSGAELRSSVLPFFSWEAAGDRIRPVLEEASGRRG
jgi:glycosyltransferase involved in cell wall biosynthesis